MFPLQEMGTITYIAAPGNYTINVSLCISAAGVFWRSRREHFDLYVLATFDIVTMHDNSIEASY